MSGPIVRRYGFPNFEKIFGERPLEHGVDDVEKSQGDAKPEDSTAAPPASGSIPTAAAPKRPPEGK